MTATDTGLWEGVDRLLTDYAQIEDGDDVIVAATSDSAGPAIWVSAALEARDVPVRRVWMDPLHDPDFGGELARSLPTEIRRRLVVITLERDTMSHAATLARAMARYPAERRATIRIISASAELFAGPMRATPGDLTRRNAVILDLLANSDGCAVTTDGGSELSIRLDPTYRWISNRGLARPGANVILPPGEVATYPASIQGRFVADFAFNVNAITDRDARLNDRPVTIELEDGRAVSWTCDDASVQAFLDECFGREHATRVGELGFGTNPFVVEPIPHNSHVNERRPGIHLGFGQHNQTDTKTGYSCPLHLDLIARGAVLTVDGTSVNLDRLTAPADIEHPVFPADQDVFAPDEDGDCCGVLTDGRLHRF